MNFDDYKLVDGKHRQNRYYKLFVKNEMSLRKDFAS